MAGEDEAARKARARETLARRGRDDSAVFTRTPVRLPAAVHSYDVQQDAAVSAAAARLQQAAEHEDAMVVADGHAGAVVAALSSEHQTKMQMLGTERAAMEAAHAAALADLEVSLTAKHSKAVFALEKLYMDINVEMAGEIAVEAAAAATLSALSGGSFDLESEDDFVSTDALPIPMGRVSPNIHAEAVDVLSSQHEKNIAAIKAAMTTEHTASMAALTETHDAALAASRSRSVAVAASMSDDQQAVQERLQQAEIEHEEAMAAATAASKEAMAAALSERAAVELAVSEHVDSLTGHFDSLVVRQEVELAAAHSQHHAAATIQRHHREAIRRRGMALVRSASAARLSASGMERRIQVVRACERLLRLAGRRALGHVLRRWRASMLDRHDAFAQAEVSGAATPSFG